MEMERQASFFLTGGLMAAHSVDRQRNSIWDSFKRREVYGTSGPRMLLWFDLLNPPNTRGRPIPMGAEAVMNENPIFRFARSAPLNKSPAVPTTRRPHWAQTASTTSAAASAFTHRPPRAGHYANRSRSIQPQNAPGEPIAPLIEGPLAILRV